MKQPVYLAWIHFHCSPSNDDIKALIAQAHRSVTKSGEAGPNGPAPIITDLIDNIMSIPSCLQDAKSKVTLVREWIKQVIILYIKYNKLNIDNIQSPMKKNYITLT